MTSAAHHSVERGLHTIRMAVDAPSLEELFTEAPLALADALGEPRRDVEPGDEVVTVRARDPESLLVTLLVELLERTLEQRRLFAEVKIDSVSDRELRAHLRGAEVAAWRLDPRSMALPEVILERRPSGFEAVVTLAT